MKKIVSLFIVITLIFTALPLVSVSADDDFSSNFVFHDCGEYFELESYNGTAEIVEIPAEYEGLPVTRIWYAAFRGNTSIKEVVIPDTVTYIGNSVFANCSNLTKVTLSENLKTIGAHAFFECKKLKKVTLPKNVMEIGDYAFGYYEDVKSGHYFLIDDFEMEGYTNSAADIYANANEISFTSIGVAPLWIWEVDDEIHKLAYIIKYNGKDKDVSVPQTLEGYEIIRINQSAFEGNPYIETVVIPETITYISGSAFEGCSNLTTVTFMGDRIRLNTRTFYNCANLDTVNFNTDAPFKYWDCEASDNTFLLTPYYENNFKDNAFYFGNSLITIDKSLKSYTIKEETRSISSGAFENCVNLESIIIPESIIEIGSTAFKGCTNLKTVELVPNRDRYISERAFLDCSSLKSITIPENTDLGYLSLGYYYGYNESTGSWGYGKLDDFTIYGTEESYAEEYATQHGFRFIVGSSEHTHSYTNACDTDCNTCGDIRTITHNYSSATCTKPKTCKICKATSGKALGHKYTNSCDTKCNVCNKTRTITHSYKTVTTKAKLSKDGKMVKKCTVCDKVVSTTKIRYPKTIKLSTKSYTYNGKAKKPSVTVKDSSGKKLTEDKDYTVTYPSGRKKVGSYKVKVKFKGNYSGTEYLTFKINPKATKVSSVSAGKKSLKVKIKEQTSQTAGYEIQYSTSKKFSSAKTKKVTSNKTTSVTLKSLKAKKTYYVRVRTYKTVDGKKYYSAWSSYKYKKTK